eukprot:7774678-Pyramimonas_sp.AAC.1
MRASTRQGLAQVVRPGTSPREQRASSDRVGVLVALVARAVEPLREARAIGQQRARGLPNRRPVVVRQSEHALVQRDQLAQGRSITVPEQQIHLAVFRV